MQVFAIPKLKFTLTDMVFVHSILGFRTFPKKIIDGYPEYLCSLQHQRFPTSHPPQPHKSKIFLISRMLKNKQNSLICNKDMLHLMSYHDINHYCKECSTNDMK